MEDTHGEYPRFISMDNFKGVLILIIMEDTHGVAGLDEFCQIGKS